MTQRSSKIEGDRTDEEIIRDLASHDDVVGEVFSKILDSLDEEDLRRLGR
jgi:hypothetical protein